ncbi:hypothetical protein RQP46_004633 [Phenoliferia psychrophenolica]
MSPGRCRTPPPRPPATSSNPTSPNGPAVAEPLLEAKFAPFQLAIGSSLSREELMIGWQDRLGSRYPKTSELTLLQHDIFFRAFPVSFATDALNPLDVQFHYSNVAEDGDVPSGRGTERDTLFDGGYEADGVARGELRGVKGVSCLGEPSALKLGRWLSYRFTLPATDLPRLKAALQELNLVRSFKPLKQSIFTNYHYSGVALTARQFHASLPFPIRYAIDGLLSFGIIIDSQVEPLLEILKDQIHDNPEKAERILHSLFRSTRIWETDLEQRIKDVNPFILSRPKRPPQSHMVFVAKVVVTPTRVLLFPPECQTSNAVLRAFPKQTEEGRFIRVQFWDEGNRLSMGYEVKGDDLDSKEGILSRFRTNAFWAVHEDTPNGFTRKRIRAVLGDFSSEKIVAKHAARRGQLFSTTRDVGVVDKVGHTPDYKTEDEEYTFSDGVGLCTQDLATTAAQTLGFATEVAGRTSAIQVRHGGTKGMLAVWPPRPVDANGDPLFMDLDWPEVGPTFEPHYDVLVRPSQVKFKSNLVNLGVVRVSVYSHAFLNREVLTLLFPRGVRHSDVTREFESQRAPTRHPGDVQIVEAVDNPALRAAGLTNVIIFNREGDRDLPSMLGGGDLDGDDYTLIWDTRLTSIRSHEPMDYIPEKAPVKVPEVTSTHIREGNVYKSNTPLGKMFRHPQLNPFPLVEPVAATFLDPRLAHIPIPITVLDMAKRLKGAYDLEVQQLMLQFQAREEEVVAGTVLELPGGLRRVEKDSKLRDPLTMAYESIRFDFVERVRLWSVSGKSCPTLLTRMELMAVAAYRSSTTGLDGPKLKAVSEGSFEWWYFDVVSDDAQSSAVVTFFTSTFTGWSLANPWDFITHVTIALKLPGEEFKFKDVNATEARITTVGNGASGNWVGSGLSFTGSADLSTYRIDIKTTTITGSISMTSTAPPHLFCGPVTNGASMKAVDGFGWVNTMPAAKATVSLNLGGKPVAFTGSGYHDHNWGDRDIYSSIQSWTWLRGSIAGYNIVFVAGTDVAGKAIASAYLNPSAVHTGTPLYSTCDSTNISVVQSGGDDDGVYDLSFYPDGPGGKKNAFHVHVQPTAQIGYANGSYTRWQGTMNGGWAGSKNSTGVALYEFLR